MRMLSKRAEWSLFFGATVAFIFAITAPLVIGPAGLGSGGYLGFAGLALGNGAVAFHYFRRARRR